MDLSAGRIVIHSGEGTTGALEVFEGTRTLRAIRMRLRKEEQNGDRWARAYIFSHTSDFGDVYQQIDGDDQRIFSPNQFK